MPLSSPGLGYVGHATVVIALDGVTMVTDPLLRRRLVWLQRYGPPPNAEWLHSLGAVLISHLHYDHCDLPSLRMLGADKRLIVPRGAGRLLQRRGFTNVEEMAPGDSAQVGSLTVTATPAHHSGHRTPFGPAAIPLGFVVSGSRRIYFAGDTDLFDEMADVGPDLDVALVPIWGWGPNLGPGHLDPQRAAEALRLLQPSLAIPIHWGTFAARAPGRPWPTYLTWPVDQFAEHAARLAPDIRVQILQPGESTSL